MLDEDVPEIGIDFEIPVFLFRVVRINCLRPQWFDSITNLSLLLKENDCLDDAGHLAILRNRALFRDALLDIKPMLLTK